MNPLDRLMLRVDHAERCLEAFKKEREAFLGSHPYHTWQKKFEVDGQRQCVGVYVEQTVEVPTELAFLSGDCIHNLRASLDNLVSAMPGADPEHSAFVILDLWSPTDRNGRPISFGEKAGRRLKGIDSVAIDLMESLQPYRPTKSSRGSNTPIGTQLLKLERLWNQDKHRAPSVVVSLVRGTGLCEPGREWLVTAPPNWPAEGPLGTLQGPRELWRVAWMADGDASEVQLEVDVELDLVFDRRRPNAKGVVFGPDLPAAGDAVELVLTDLYHCVREDILPVFQPFL